MSSSHPANPPSVSRSDIEKELQIPQCLHTTMDPTPYPKFDIAIYTDIGGRKYQEDRFTFTPKLVSNRDDCSFFGVFDGTVGDFASDNVKGLVVPHLLNTAGWRRIKELLESSPNKSLSPEVANQIPGLLESAIVGMYKNSDEELLYMCSQNKKDYAASTSVTAVLVAGFLGIGHLGDSRIALGFERNGQLLAEFLTTDHKPDQPVEKARIERSTGSVEYLHNHNNKPFIRGADFTARKQAGEQPMQLQYSRAFGGKDLKPYGLSNEPDVRVLPVDPNFRCIILASDGLWDVLTAEYAVDMAMKAKSENRNPSEALVASTLLELLGRNQSADNITAVSVVFKH